MVVSVQRVLEKKVRRLVSDPLVRRSRLHIGVNVGSWRRVWYLGILGIGQFAHLHAICEGAVAVLVPITLRKKGDGREWMPRSFGHLGSDVDYPSGNADARKGFWLTKATI